MMSYEVCANCEHFEDDFFCNFSGECCDDMKRCPKTLKKYKVHVHVVMEADVYVYAENDDEAGDIVSDNVYPIDYSNETCGFEYDCDKVDEMDNITCDCNYMDIITVEEYADNEKDAFTLWETYGTADLEDVIMMLYDETEG